MTLRDEILDAVDSAKKPPDGWTERETIANFLATAGHDKGVIFRRIGQMVSTGALVQGADGRVRRPAEGDAPPPAKRRKKRRQKEEVVEEALAATVVAEDFRCALADDGGLLIIGVLADSAILEFTPDQVARIRKLIAPVAASLQHLTGPS